MSALVTVPFHGDELVAVDREGVVFVALKPIVTSLGLDWSGQHQRVRRDEVLREGMGVIPIPSGSGVQEATALRLDLLNGWLFTIDSARVRPTVRDKLIRYQRECYAALHAHFTRAQPPVPAAAPPVDAELLRLAEKRQLVAEARQSFDAQAARELWIELGLPLTPSMTRMSRPAAAITERVVELLGAAVDRTLWDWEIEAQLVLESWSKVRIAAALDALRSAKRVKFVSPGGYRARFTLI